MAAAPACMRRRSRSGVALLALVLALARCCPSRVEAQQPSSNVTDMSCVDQRQQLTVRVLQWCVARAGRGGFLCCHLEGPPRAGAQEV